MGILVFNYWKMVTIELKAPTKYKEYLEENDEFQGIINEVFHDYVEKKQDEKIKEGLFQNSSFFKLNHSLEKKLGNL